MSRDALKAFAALRPHLGQMKAALHLTHSRGVSTEAIAEVGRQLAYRYDPQRRGYVDERVDQLAAALGMAPSKVLRATQVLDRLGIWTAERHGGSRDGYGSRRIPGPELCAAAHRLGLNLSTPQTALELAPELRAPVLSDTPELRAPVLSDTPELRAPVLSDTPELRAPVHGTQSTGARTESTGARTESTGALLPIGTYIETPNRHAQPIDLPATRQMRRREEVLTEFGRQAVERRYAPPNNPAKYAATAIAGARKDMGDLNRWLKTYPNAPANQIASWMHGDKHSMQYANEAQG